MKMHCIRDKNLTMKPLAKTPGKQVEFAITLLPYAKTWNGKPAPTKSFIGSVWGDLSHLLTLPMGSH